MKKAMSLLTATAMAATLLAGWRPEAPQARPQPLPLIDLYRSQQHGRRACCRCSRRGGKGPEHLVLER